MVNGNLERAASSPKASGPTLAAGQALVLGLRPKEEDSIGLQSPRVSAGIVKHATLIQRGLEVTRGGQRQIHTGGSVQLEFTCIFFSTSPKGLDSQENRGLSSIRTEGAAPHPGPVARI